MADVPPESMQTPKVTTGRFAGTFWKNIADLPRQTPVTICKNCLHDQSDGFQATEEGSSESVDSTGDYEHRHKRVVSDPPPLESWHTTGKL